MKDSAAIHKEVVVSMTSFPGAIAYAPGALRSILNGSVLPDRLVLYVTLSQFGEKGLPEELLELERNNPIFEIRDYPDDIRSYRKLVPALADFPDAVIVTVDDDVAYHRNMLKDLLKYHSLYPRHILAHRAKRILPDRPYRKWKKYRWYHFLFRKNHSGLLNIQTGVGGVLYPPRSLKADMLDVELFRRLAPTADDIWFWAAAVNNGTRIMPVPFGHNKPKGLGKPRELSLKTLNFKSGEDLNSMYFHNIVNEYPNLINPVEINEPIDLVYLWVDGNDPAWRARRNAFLGTPEDCEGRYADNDELRYSLRSIHAYAPWIRRIFIVTDRQIPSWLNTSDPRIRIVDHTDILPPEALPTYNSTVIEHALFRIPGLAEHFLYANDDMFLNRQVSPSDFFTTDGRPVARLNRRPYRKFTLWLKEKILRKPISTYNKTIANSARLVDRKYGRYIGHKTHHNIDAYRKSDYEHAYNVFKQEIDATLTNHLRAENDIQRNLYTYVALAEDCAVSFFVDRKTSFRFHIDNPDHYAKLQTADPVFFCLNDSQFALPEHRELVRKFLVKRFPDKSPFEK